MITVDKLLASGFIEPVPDTEEYQKEVPVKALSEPVRALFAGTDVEDVDTATVWIDPDQGVGISVWDCNAHYGFYDFDDAIGQAILRDAGYFDA